MGNLYVGSFYDGWRFSIGLRPTWSLSPSFELSGYYEYNHASFSDRNQLLNAIIARIRAMWMLNTTLTISTFIQYNSIADAIISNIRIRYNPREGNDFYLVYDEGNNTNRYKEFPVLPATSNRTLLLKYTYTFIL
jgi:hypothetical protein